jgi:cyclic pyranopterin phosphate synthase
MQVVFDNYGRRITSMRISLTQQCNLNCFYCHREGLPPSDSEMSVDEIESIVKLGSTLGINKVKLTGGEPLLRKDVTDIVSGISAHVDDLSMTTNGTLLKAKAVELKEAGLARMNINLNTLDPRVYRKITGKDILKSVIDGLYSAKDAGFKPIKLNMVLLNEVNNEEIDDMALFSSKLGAVLQLIELETAKGGVESDLFTKYHFDLGPIEKMLENKAVDIKENPLHRRGKYFMSLNNSKTSTLKQSSVHRNNGFVEIEVVRPMHNTESGTAPESG